MFKIGDRVKRIAGDFCGMSPRDIGTIIFILDNKNISIEEYGGIEKKHISSNFELVKEKPQKIIKRFGIADFVDGLNKK